MAFNPFVTFQRNRRFWMAGILLICMISFVFFGFKGGCDERIPRLFGQSGPTVATIGGHNISRRDLEELKTQRNLANTYMKHCAELAYKNVSKRFFDMKKVGDDKDLEKRQQTLAYLENVRQTLGIRKSRPRYFDGGVKFDDLLEFKLWQAEADRLGIKIEEDHLQFLFAREFFMSENFRPLGPEELFSAQREARQEFRDASDTYVRRAVAEEFRVKIAQYAMLLSQPYSLIYRRQQQQGLGDKFVEPDAPDEVRAPITLAQIWDFYKAQRSEFGVTLIQVPVQNFVGKIKDPDEIQKQDHFNANKNDAYDPSSDKSGLEIPPQFKIEYLMADALSPAYLGEAKMELQLKLTNPIALDALQSPLMAAARYMAVAQKHKMDLQGQYEREVSRVARHFRGAALNSELDYTTPILARMADRHPQAIASLIGAAALGSEAPVNVANATAGYLAWGTKKYPLEGTVEIGTDKDKTTTLTKILPNYDQLRYGSKDKNDVNHKDHQDYQYGELEVAFNSEMRRRLPVYRDHIAYAWGTAGGFAMSMSPAVLPLEVFPAFLTMDQSGALPIANKDGQPLRDIFGKVLFESVYAHPLHTIETAQREFDDMLVRRLAEEHAQENILAAKLALEQAGGPDPAQSFRRELQTLVPTLKLTYGPPDDKKGEYHDRFSIEKAEEFAKLREAYLKYIDVINLYEARDLKPDSVLKPQHFSKMFYGTEPFAAVAKYRVMPWPPEVKADNSREISVVHPRFIKNVTQEDKDRIRQHLNEHDPNRPAPSLALYKSAERPILFWRTAELNALRPTEYKQIDIDRKKFKKDRELLESQLQKNAKDAQLPAKIAELKKKEADLQYVMERVTEGFKFERARKQEALPKAKEIAKELIGVLDKPGLMKSQAATLAEEFAKLTGAKPGAAKQKTDLIELMGLSLMHQEAIGAGQDYSLPTLPKDTIPYSRDDMMQQILSLNEMKGPIKTGNTELDELNKDLYDQALKQKGTDRFVQILTNKPRSIFYVAAITMRQQPELEKRPFMVSMVNAKFPPPNDMSGPGRRDRFVDRAQEQEAITYRAEFIKGLQAAHDFAIVDSQARAVFDGSRDEK